MKTRIVIYIGIILICFSACSGCQTTTAPEVTPSPTSSLVPSSIYTPTPTSTYIPTAVPTTTPTTSVYELRVNCGGTSFIDSNVNNWEADQLYSGNTWGRMGGNLWHTTVAIANTIDDVLYQKFNYYPTVEYRFDVPNGNYDVTIKMVENQHNPSNPRVFSIYLEGVKKVDSLNLYNQVGEYYAYDVIISTVVSDGVLNVVGTDASSSAEFCAIYVYGTY